MKNGHECVSPFEQSQMLWHNFGSWIVQFISLSEGNIILLLLSNIIKQFFLLINEICIVSPELGQSGFHDSASKGVPVTLPSVLMGATGNTKKNKKPVRKPLPFHLVGSTKEKGTPGGEEKKYSSHVYEIISMWNTYLHLIGAIINRSWFNFHFTVVYF